MKRALIVAALIAIPAYAAPPYIVSQDGKYLGTLDGQYDPESVNNPYGRYGSKYSPDSANNPYAISPPRIVGPHGR